MKKLLPLIVFLSYVSFGSAQPDVVINELMASNQNTVEDPAGQNEDWIELYNTTSQDIDLSGYFLSDNPENRKKWEFPEGTIIWGNGYLIVWADEDGDNMQDGIHSSFKLAKTGETLLFSNPDSSIINEITFGEQITDMGYARSPNATGNFVIKSPTFKANNDTGVSVINEAIEGVSIFPNPATESLLIELNEQFPSDNVVKIYNAYGQMMMETKMGKSITIPVSSYESGHYFGVISDKSFQFIVL